MKITRSIPRQQDVDRRLREQAIGRRLGRLCKCSVCGREYYPQAGGSVFTSDQAGCCSSTCRQMKANPVKIK